jgi:hypothetical protein
MSDNETLARMKAYPFAPIQGDLAMRQAHAADYSAYYLGQIAERLQEIAIILRDENTNSSKLAESAGAIAHILPNMKR